MEYPLLSKIKSPDDIKKVDPADFDKLCNEIRSKLIETVSSNGGHLASNLGTVELTVALHRVFNSPDDKIIWDVSHQAYTHKLITGRFDSFDSIRKENGISGFTRPDESVHDSFYEGHAGTSVSQAAGIAFSNQIKGNKNYAVAVVGDGSFGNGLIYEALNNSGKKGLRLIVILNDNEMSISKNVGAVARNLAVIRAKPEYYRFKAGTEKALNHIPLIGRHLSNCLFKIKNTLKNILYKSSFFEDMGFRYIGPIDGHDIPTLIEAMNSAKMIDRPVVIHVNTIKGKGYDFAESSPELYHGISQFNVITGEPKHSGDTYSKEFGRLICDFASNDKRICAVTAAMALGTGLEEFFETYPDRSFDVGIAEEHAVTFCSGLTAGGLLPVFAVYSTFLQRCFDQLIHDGALQRRKMVIAVDRAGFVGDDGETHQGIFDVSMLLSIPYITVYSPATYEDLSRSLYNAFYRDSNLVVIRYPRGSAVQIDCDGLTGGEYEIIGDDDFNVSIVCYGKVFFEALKAKNVLDDSGIKTRIIKLNRIWPFSNELINEFSDNDNVYFFEESIKNGSVGEKLSSLLLENGYTGSFKHIAVDNEFVAHASVDSLFKKYSLDSGSIYNLIFEECNDERKEKA